MVNLPILPIPQIFFMFWFDRRITSRLDPVRANFAATATAYIGISGFISPISCLEERHL